MDSKNASQVTKQRIFDFIEQFQCGAGEGALRGRGCSIAEAAR